MIEEHNSACFIVKDATAQALGYSPPTAIAYQLRDVPK
jgi:hypothetical protein